MGSEDAGMLARWLRVALDAAGAGDVPDAVTHQETVELILGLAGDAAHRVARPAAPLAAFAVGLAVGQRGASAPDVREAVARVKAAASGWEAE